MRTPTHRVEATRRKEDDAEMIATSTGKVRKREWRYCPTCRVSWGEEDGEHPAPKTEGQSKCSFKGLKRGAYEYSIVVDGERKRKQFPSKAEAQDALDARKEEVKRPKIVEPPKPKNGAGRETLN